MVKAKNKYYFMKHVPFFVVFCMSIFLLSGCWDRVEINDIAIVTGTAIDKRKGKGIELSLQVFVPSSISSGGGGTQGGGGGPLTLVVTQKGKNMADALSKIQSELPRRIFWGQCKVFIFSEKVAKEGIKDHLDFLLRHPQPRERAYVFVSQGKAKHILDLKAVLERHSAEGVRELADLRVGLKATLQNLDEMLKSESESSALPYLVTFKGKKSGQENPEFLKIFGSAVLKKGKMIGKISEKNTRGVLWLRDEIKEYTVTVDPKNIEGDVSLNPVSAHINMIPKIKNGKWKMTVKIKTEGEAVQNRMDVSIIDSKTIKEIEKSYQEAIKKRINTAIRLSQHKLKADILNFGKEFHRKYPKEWKKVAKRWEEVFPEVEVELDIDAHVRRKGIIHKSKGIEEEGF
ncbi:spore germination protein KC [Oikeobacillus pervagus]|uniref:Spore germination protein KC n=1 Tax=Oikeobacillus pervagus TaxID=1325931 RepID=A0AAJ1T0Y0_9BACI|nr:Ger(x)C family spore germination protein [Oikeobacillus pervagus]MDQ0216254.1 spore germination protein KC [Oikeobacillus pervagus]